MPTLLCRSMVLGLFLSAPLMAASPGSGLDQVLNQENTEAGVQVEAAPLVDDLAYLRRVSVDLIGRIPTTEEIEEYLAWSPNVRREKVVDKLLSNERFAVRWTAFFADMLRLRTNAEGGAALTAFVHKSLEEGMPYDELARRLISAGGKSGAVPEVGYILSDDADPLALAGITSQVFMGVRIACAECHDHPFDKWTREDFYGFAAYFGKTRRVQRQFNNRILATYTTEVDQTTVLWPPPGVEDESRKPIPPKFPIQLVDDAESLAYLDRLRKLRAQQQVAKVEKEKPEPAENSIDDLLASADDKVKRRTSGEIDSGLGVVEEAKKDVQKINVKEAGYRPSELRRELASLITSPRNRYFSRSFVNRVWKELVGLGFVEPIDDFSDNNPPNHPETLDYLANEFVANGYDLRTLVKMVVTSEAYQRGHAENVDEATRLDMEQAFLATPMRRMISETLYDSIVTAGHLFDVKHAAGKNMKVVWQQTRVMKKPTEGETQVDTQRIAQATTPKPAMNKPAMKKPGAAGYDVEQAIELDFDAILKKNQGDDVAMVDKMMAKSAEEIEAERMLAERRQRQADYFDRFVKTVIDDNPKFTSAFLMASPAPPEHFLRVFGQPGRSELGDFRDESATMRQQLMILNGRLVHEASRVGEKEPIYNLLTGEKAELDRAIDLAYREILTRNPTSEEVELAKEVIGASEDQLAGMADLRWVLINSNEFRFLP